MPDPVRELKTRAEILHRRLAQRNLHDLRRLRALPEYAPEPDSGLVTLAPSVRRRECLALLAVELGFDGWPHARHVLAGDGAVADFGTMLYPPHLGGHLNLWYRNYEEALTGLRASGGYLLPYRRHFMVVQPTFVQALGLDPDDADWRALGFDWVRPASMAARSRLYGALLAQLPPEAERGAMWMRGQRDRRSGTALNM